LFFEAVIRPPNVFECSFGSFRARTCMAGQVVGLGLQPPRSGQAEFVADLGEDGD